ncbi:hypothetical protein B0H13DRAFT_327603 [Mycena leptocephala]|nr:hypothetical protein B0H13DRAFT_327603 [Mycena leptocephala]
MDRTARSATPPRLSTRYSQTRRTSPRSIGMLYPKEERPLLAQEYAQQQPETFTVIQTAGKEAARVVHEEHLETKKRLVRMMPDYEARVILPKNGEEYAKKTMRRPARTRRRPSGSRPSSPCARLNGRPSRSRSLGGKSKRESRRSAESKRSALQKTVRRRPTARYLRGSGSRQQRLTPPSAPCSTWGLARNFCIRGRRPSL